MPLAESVAHKAMEAGHSQAMERNEVWLSLPCQSPNVLWGALASARVEALENRDVLMVSQGSV